MNDFYGRFADWWPLISPVAGYAEESEQATALLHRADGPVRRVLELGSGGGHNAFHLKASFDLTLVDLSPDMLRVSAALNPECRHEVGDMRTVRLGETFDAVFVHDAIAYMTTEADLDAAIATAAVHCRDGGVVVLVPDDVDAADLGADCGGSDGDDGRAVRYLEWSWDPDPTDTEVLTAYVFTFRHPDGRLETAHEVHRMGVFPRATWVACMRRQGLYPDVVVESEVDWTPRTIFVGHKRSPLSEDAVVAQLRDLGVREGGVLVVHTSFRAVRPVAGGPEGLIRALRRALGPDGTLVMPTMTDGASPFDPATTPTDGMGIAAETFWRQAGVIRSTHPGGSFAAAGPHAAAICAPQPLSPPHGPDSPVGRAHALGGQVLLLGVHHSEDTTVHLAEAIAGVPYRIAHPCVVVVEGIPSTIQIPETDHCCEGFRVLDAWLGDRQRVGRVGWAETRLADAADVVAVAVRALTADPLTFLCAPDAGCEECDAARASIPG